MLFTIIAFKLHGTRCAYDYASMWPCARARMWECVNNTVIRSAPVLTKTPLSLFLYWYCNLNSYTNTTHTTIHEHLNSHREKSSSALWNLSSSGCVLRCALKHGQCKSKTQCMRSDWRGWERTLMGQFSPKLSWRSVLLRFEYIYMVWENSLQRLVVTPLTWFLFVSTCTCVELQYQIDSALGSTNCRAASRSSCSSK